MIEWGREELGRANEDEDFGGKQNTREFKSAHFAFFQIIRLVGILGSQPCHQFHHKIPSPFHKLPVQSISLSMPSTRSQRPNNIAEPGLVPPTSKPVKCGRQPKNSTDKDKEESHPISNKLTARIRQTKANKGAPQKATTAAPKLAGGASDEPTPAIPPQARKCGQKPVDKVENAPPAKNAKDDEKLVLPDQQQQQLLPKMQMHYLGLHFLIAKDVMSIQRGSQ
jgi:hypothetical protein